MPEIIELMGSKNRWTLSSLGGRIAGWQALDGKEWRTICKGDPNLKPSADAHRAIVMFPWVNRIGGDHWMLEDQRVKLDLSGPLTHLHGRTYDEVWDVAEKSATGVLFRYVLEPHEFYPRRIEATTRRLWSTGDAATALANASTYLEAVGHVTVAWLWLDQLVVAGDRTGPFFDGKRVAARHFFRHLLPAVHPMLDLLESLDTSLIDLDDTIL